MRFLFLLVVSFFRPLVKEADFILPLRPRENLATAELTSPPLEEMLHPSPSTLTPSLPTQLPGDPLTYDPTSIVRSLPVYSAPSSTGSTESEGGGQERLDEENGGGSEEGDDESSVVGSRGGGKEGVRVTFK